MATEFDRRTFLAKVAVAVGATAVPGQVRAEAQAQPTDSTSIGNFPGLLTREHEPKNLEYPFPTLSSTVVPTNQFFVRGHFPIPRLDAVTWSLKVDGAVNKPLSLSYEDLLKLPSKTFTATIECAGNGRGFLVPRANGVLWEFGGVGNAEWTGVPLATVLERAGIKEGAVEVILQGADSGAVNSDPKSPGPVHFERSLPLEKARRPEVLLAYQMNGKPLTPEHGSPVRALVAGWYGMASVKWLKRTGGAMTAAPR